MHYFSQSSIFCVHPSAAAGLRQDFVNDKNGEILLCVTLPVRSFAERPRGWVLYSRSTGRWAPRHWASPAPFFLIHLPTDLQDARRANLPASHSTSFDDNKIEMAGFAVPSESLIHL